MPPRKSPKPTTGLFVRKVPTTPEQAARQAKHYETKKRKELERLEELRRFKALDRMQLKRHDPEVPQETLKQLFGVNRERAVKVIVAIATHAKDDMTRFAAAQYILARTDGHIPKPVEIGGKDGGPIVVSDERPSLAQLLGVAVQEAISSAPQIDGAVEETEETGET